ncbi:TadE/TadG family type IV pilus assembly protein [Litorimonas sp. RW-G-Af-16]|uniref:TadE/TadG family type IV pilus assembly protein n=1 Tax=Litorimonas sp. RW-G-Af-16 TaxID=3241168 RepID=UPI00390C9E49
MMATLWHKFRRSTTGSVTVEAAFVIPMLIVLMGGGVELSYGFYQWNGANQAARHGARLAATSNPVAADLRSMTGMGGGTKVGDPMPYYSRKCSGETKRCDSGSFDQRALNAIVFGPDQDMTCAATARKRRGMCDVFGGLDAENIRIDYVGSGLGRAGFPADPAPLITVTVTDLEYDFVFLDLILPDSIRKIPSVSASHMGEDLRSG